MRFVQIRVLLHLLMPEQPLQHWHLSPNSFSISAVECKNTFMVRSVAVEPLGSRRFGTFLRNVHGLQSQK